MLMIMYYNEQWYLVLNNNIVLYMAVDGLWDAIAMHCMADYCYIHVQL